MVAKPARKSVALVVPPSAQSLDVSGPLDAFSGKQVVSRQSSVARRGSLGSPVGSDRRQNIISFGPAEIA